MTPLRRPAAPLFVQLLGLILLSLMTAVAVNLLVVLNFPPPVPDFYRVSEIADVVNGRPAPADPRPLVSRIVPQPDDPGAPTDFPGGFRHALGRLTGVDPAQIIIKDDSPLFHDRRMFRSVRREIAKVGGPDERYLIAPFRLYVHRPDGRWLLVQPKPSLKLTPWQLSILTWLVLSVAAIAPIAYVFARWLAAPITAFAAGAERLGRDPHAPPLEIRGPAEIAVAVTAFNGMQERLLRYVDDRTAMMGSVAHDLRTPLTRLRFRAEMAPDELRQRMVTDIEEMEAMISATLAFVRDATQPGERTRLELSSLLETLVDEMSDTGSSVAIERAERLVIDGDPVALRRLFNNLLDNAVKFGKRATVRVYADEGCAVAEIDDEGAGLPARQLERVFEPFYRHETSRSRETGGIGLGLAVVRSVARAHGGEATLENRQSGGLRARVRLPV